VPNTPDLTASKPPSAPPAPGAQPAGHAYKLAYAVHSTSASSTPRFIGLVSLASLSGYFLPLPSHLVIAPDLEPTTLVTELAYSFLPAAWGKGYATEALTAVLDACRSPSSGAFWAPWERVWMRVIVNRRNAASLKVMRKLSVKGVVEKGVYEWKGKSIFIGGEWRTEDDLCIFGGWLRE
jgi:RimJ/RimL family protein N-acetyltransferase